MKALFVGLGGIGQRHLRNLRALCGDDVEVIAYRVRRQQLVLTDRLQIETGADLESKYRVTVCDDLEAALRQRPDVAFVCNPSSLHLETALAAAQARCHLFIEKPLSDRLEQVDELIDLVKRQGRVGFVGYQLRFHPCFLRLQKWLRSKAMGRVLAVRAEVGEYLPNWHPYEDYRQMYAARRELGGGVVLSQIHELDYLYALFGLPRKMFAVGGQLSSLEVDVEDVVSILMECVGENGAGFPVHLHQDYVQRPPGRSCQVVGDTGKAIIDFGALSARRWDETGALVESEDFTGLERNELFLAEMKHFLACLAGDETPLVSLRDGAQSLRMALAAKGSLASGEMVTLS